MRDTRTDRTVECLVENEWRPVPWAALRFGDRVRFREAGGALVVFHDGVSTEGVVVGDPQMQPERNVSVPVKFGKLD